MHQILVWPILEQTKIIFQSDKANLETITCCDYLTIILQKFEASTCLVQHLSGCGLSHLQTELEQFVQKKINRVNFNNVLLLDHYSDQSVSLKVKVIDVLKIDCLIDWAIVKGWIAQLELLSVLMEENENEQKSRGKGCC